MVDANPVASGAAMNRAPATDAAAALLAALVARGVRHVVVSPGSRSQALALVAAELERAGRIRLHVRIDERVAGFTAVGIGRETRMPAAVICTSGTAVANLMPAVLEAHHSGVPLLLLTADRPPELRGVGANQTTRQPGMFSPCVRFERDLPTPEGDADPRERMRGMAKEAMTAALGVHGVAGPVHLNLPYREPLAGAVPEWLVEESRRAPDAADERRGAPTPTVLGRGPRTIVVAGADAGEAAEEIAHAGGFPLVAEIVSGARFGRHLVHGYRALLRDPELGGAVERVIVFGHPTLTREVTRLLSRADVSVVAVAGPGESLNLNGATRHVAAVLVEQGEPDRSWLGAWMRASRSASVDLSPAAPDAEGLASAEPSRRLVAIADEVAVMRAPLDRETLVDAVWRASWPHDRLVFGSSRLVRVADQVLGGKKVPVHANRGLAGIDGTVATATGVALGSQDEGTPGVTRVLLGDLALLHDAGALLHPVGEGSPRLQVIVGNDGGGTIFDGLEVASLADADAMARVLYTPQSVSLEDLARAYGWEYSRPGTRTELDQVLTEPYGGRQLIEVRLDR